MAMGGESVLLSGDVLTPKKVFEAARDGDRAARETVDESVRMLGLALANLVTTLNPGVIIVGGQVAEAGPLLFEPLVRRSGNTRWTCPVAPSASPLPN